VIDCPFRDSVAFRVVCLFEAADLRLIVFNDGVSGSALSIISQCLYSTGATPIASSMTRGQIATVSDAFNGGNGHSHVSDPVFH
jgi:hypothetical protein